MDYLIIVTGTTEGNKAGIQSALVSADNEFSNEVMIQGVPEALPSGVFHYSQQNQTLAGAIERARERLKNRRISNLVIGATCGQIERQKSDTGFIA